VVGEVQGSFSLTLRGIALRIQMIDRLLARHAGHVPRYAGFCYKIRLDYKIRKGMKGDVIIGEDIDCVGDLPKR